MKPICMLFTVPCMVVGICHAAEPSDSTTGAQGWVAAKFLGGRARCGGPNFKKSYGDIVRTDITQFIIQGVLAEGIDTAVRQVLTRLESRALDNVWLHVDCDVLDQTVMPAVDSPGNPGLNYQQLSMLIGELCHSGRIVGADFTIYDPERDPHGKYSKPLADCIAGNPQPAISQRAFLMNPQLLSSILAVALIAMWRSVWELFGVPLSPDDRRGRTSVASREPRVALTIGVNI
jgi:hypothetical protein